MKKGKGLVIVIVILSILLLSSIGYILYDKLYVSEADTVQKDKDTISKQLVDSLYDSLVVGQGLKYGFYYDEKVTIDNIPDKVLLGFIASGYIEDNSISNYEAFLNTNKMKYFIVDDESEDYSEKYIETPKNYVVKSEVFLDLIKEKFNVDKNISLKDKTRLYNIFSKDFSFVIYNQDNNSYYLGYAPGAHDSPYVKREFVNYKENGNELYIYDKAIVCYGDYACYKSYPNISEKILINNMEELFSHEDEAKYDKYLDENDSWSIDKISKDFDVNTFKHTFKKASNGYYYWYSTEIDNSYNGSK